MSQAKLHNTDYTEFPSVLPAGELWTDAHSQVRPTQSNLGLPHDPYCKLNLPPTQTALHLLLRQEKGITEAQDVDRTFK